jgi:sugar phosphate permease
MNRKGSIKLHWGWVVLGTSFITLFINYSIRIGAYPVLLPEMITDLRITKAQAGTIKSAYSITYLIFSPLMGWLTDRFGGKKVISFFCLFLGGGAFLMGKAENLLASALFFGMVGIGSAAMWVPNATLVQKWFSTRKKGLVLGIISASSGVGSGLMGLFLPAIAIEYNWRIGWFILGIAGLSLFLLNGLLLRDRPEDMNLAPWGGSLEETREKDDPSKRTGFFETLKQSQFWIIGISYFLICYGSYALLDFVVTYGKIELYIPYSIASLFISVSAFIGIPGGILMMILSDHIGTRKSIKIIYGLMPLSILSIIMGGNHVFLLMAGVGWFGFLYGAVFPMVAACARDYFPREATGTAFGLLTFFYGAASVISPVLTGYLADVTGTFKWSFSLGAFAALMGFLLTTFLREPNHYRKLADPMPLP